MVVKIRKKRGRGTTRVGGVVMWRLAVGGWRLVVGKQTVSFVWYTALLVC